MLHSKRYPGLYIKEEGANPTGTFKARGLGLAVTMAKHYGLQHLAVPSAGNAAGALAAYAAAAGIAAHIFMPQDVPFANYLEGIVYGADVTMVDGLISDCARIVGDKSRPRKKPTPPPAKSGSTSPPSRSPSASKARRPWATNSSSSSAGTTPTPSSTPPAAASASSACGRPSKRWKQLGWVTGKAPEDVRPPGRGCAPIVSAFDEHKPASEFFQNAATFAAGLRVPKPYGDSIILDIVAQSGGKAIASDDAESSPASSTGPATKASSSPPKAPPPPPPTTSSSHPASSSPPTKSSSSTPAPASSTPT